MQNYVLSVWTNLRQTVLLPIACNLLFFLIKRFIILKVYINLLQYIAPISIFLNFIFTIAMFFEMSVKPYY